MEFLNAESSKRNLQIKKPAFKENIFPCELDPAFEL